MKVNYDYKNGKATFTLTPSKDVVQAKIIVFGNNWEQISRKDISINSASPLTITAKEGDNVFDSPRIVSSIPDLDVEDVSSIDFLVVIETTEDGCERKKFIFIDSPRYWKIIAETGRTTGFISRHRDLNDIENTLNITIYIVDTFKETWLNHHRYGVNLRDPNYYSMCLKRIKDAQQ